MHTNTIATVRTSSGMRDFVSPLCAGLISETSRGRLMNADEAHDHPQLAALGRAVSPRAEYREKERREEVVDAHNEACGERAQAKARHDARPVREGGVARLQDDREVVVVSAPHDGNRHVQQAIEYEEFHVWLRVRGKP